MARPGFVVLALSYLAFVSLGVPDTVLGVAWPSLQAAFHISPSSLGALLASGLTGYFLSGLLAGSAVARLGVGGVLTLSSALVATGWLGAVGVVVIAVAVALLLAHEVLLTATRLPQPRLGID